MKLVQYLFQHNVKQKDLAKEIGVTDVYLSSLLKGQIPSIKLAKVIEEVTSGTVTKEELLFPEEY